MPLPGVSPCYMSLKRISGYVKNYYKGFKLMSYLHYVKDKQTKIQNRGI